MSGLRTKFAEIDAAIERATLRRERMQLLDRLGPVAGLVSAALASGDRGDWTEARRRLEEADRVLVDDASQERAEQLAQKDEGEERFND